MTRAAHRIPEKLVDEFAQLQDEYSKYSELTEKEAVIMKKLSKSILLLQRTVGEVIPLSPAVLSKIFPRAKEVNLRKDGTVETINKKGIRVSMRLEELPPQVFIAAAKDAVSRLNEIVEERHSRQVRIRELVRVDFIVERIRKFLVYRDEITYLQIVNRSKENIQVTLSVLREGDWATYKGVKLAVGEQTKLYLGVLRILETPLPIKFQLTCQDSEGEDYREVFTLGPIPPHSEGLSQPIIAQEPG